MNWRRFIWLYFPKYRKRAAEKSADLVEKRLNGVFDELSPKRLKQLAACISLIVEINETNTLDLLREYHDWISKEK